MKTLETLYQEVLASNELKKSLAEAAKPPEALAEWVRAQGCEATAEEILAFLKEKQEKAGELTDDELENAAGGCDAGEAITSVFTVGIACAGMAILSAMSDSYRRGSNDTLLCHGMVV